MEQGERWLSLAIFFSFYRIDFRGRCDSYESHLPLIWTIYFPTAPSFHFLFRFFPLAAACPSLIHPGIAASTLDFFHIAESADVYLIPCIPIYYSVAVLIPQPLTADLLLYDFSAACLIRVFGVRGLFPAFVLFGLPALLWAPALFLLGVQSLAGAQQLLRRTWGDGRGTLPFNRGYWLRACVCIGLSLAGGLL